MSDLCICECGHDRVKHSRKRCNGLDSYECPCDCPSFVEWENWEDYEG